MRVLSCLHVSVIHLFFILLGPVVQKPLNLTLVCMPEYEVLNIVNGEGAISSGKDLFKMKTCTGKAHSKYNFVVTPRKFIFVKLSIRKLGYSSVNKKVIKSHDS